GWRSPAAPYHTSGPACRGAWARGGEWSSLSNQAPIMTSGPVWRRMWGEAIALFDRARKVGWVDMLVVVGLAGALFGLIHLGQQWTGPHRASVEIDLSPWALPLYTFYSLCRGLAAYVLSLSFTLVYGYWAAKDRRAERVLIPMLDILQSIPVL